MRVFLPVLLLCVSIHHTAHTQTAKKELVQELLDSFRISANYPGISCAVEFASGEKFAVASGYADKELKKPLNVNDRFLQGSVGKTYVAAIALRLVNEKKINFDYKVKHYLGDYPWFHRIPNAEDITVRMLMNHTSGVMRYEFKEAFTKDLTANPQKEWSPAELLAYILDEKAAFPAGSDWEYSDTNYILLGMIIEKVTGVKYYDLLKKLILDPFDLKNTFPSDGRKLNGLVQGYAGADNTFGGKDKVIGNDGNFIINPQFEWTGGGVYSTTSDLVKWGSLLYNGKVVDTATMIWYAVPAKLGRSVKYGMGVIIRETKLGPGYGHSGFFPGYVTEMLYFPAYQMCIALQANSSDFKNLKGGLLRALLLIAERIAPSR